MLQNRRHRSDPKRLLQVQRGRHRVLRVDRKFGLAGGTHEGRAVLGRLHDLHVQPGFFIIAQSIRHIEARVIRVRRPIQAERDVPELLRLLCRSQARSKKQSQCRSCQSRRNSCSSHCISPFLSVIYILTCLPCSAAFFSCTWFQGIAILRRKSTSPISSRLTITINMITANILSKA